MFTHSTYKAARIVRIPVSIDNAMPDELDRVAAVLRDGPDAQTATELRSEEVQLIREDGHWFLEPVIK